MEEGSVKSRSRERPKILLYKSARGRFYWLGGNSSEEWKGSSNGKWSFACNPRKKWIVTPLNNMTCSWIWKTNAFPKMKLFLWPCFQGRIATRELLWKKRHHRVAFLSSLPRQYWTLIHILRDGKVARDVWNAIHIPTTIENFLVLTVNDWLRLNCQGDVIPPCCPLEHGFPCCVLDLVESQKERGLQLDNNSCPQSAWSIYWLQSPILWKAPPRTLCKDVSKSRGVACLWPLGGWCKTRHTYFNFYKYKCTCFHFLYCPKSSYSKHFH